MIQSKRGKKYLTFVGDFETTVMPGQTSTEVWASALVQVGTEDVVILNSIEATFDYLKLLSRSCIVYYHNLKFDGSFWMAYLLKRGYVNGIDQVSGDWKKTKDLKDGEMTYTIADTGEWYKLTFRVGKRSIELRDSYKLLPFTVKKIGKDFKTKHQKLDMRYEGERHAGGIITDAEKQYIANDVLVVKEGLEEMFAAGFNKLTIGSCCLSEYKNLARLEFDWDKMFPDMYSVPLEPEIFGAENADQYIRKSYKGGWCYCAKGKEKRVYHNGTTADVNSLYPSMMWGKSGNRYPVGLPTFWRGNYIPDEAKVDKKYYFIRFRCSFQIKKNYLPFVQIKGHRFYAGNEMLESSDVVYKGKKYKRYRAFDGSIQKAVVELTMTCTDWVLFNEHYDISDLEILDGCWFYTRKGLFDEYIEKYKRIKQTSTGSRRALAKLALNNLYGKMAASKRSNYKVAYLKEGTNTVLYSEVEASNKKPGYIPVGSAITSYARNFTIRAAQANYYGKDKPGFIYADTDSIHCDLAPDQMRGIKVDDTEFCCWKLESCWDYGWFVRQKTYIEHVTHENLQPIEKPYYNVKCAGLSQRCKDLFLHSVLQDYKEGDEGLNTYTEEEKDFMKVKRTPEDFKEGIIIPGKLIPKRIDGGVVLVNTTFELRENGI